jgi:phosphatidylglycerophosphatase C
MKAGLALFDFDGTITSMDSATLFYRSLYNNPIVFVYRHIVLCFPQYISYRLKLSDYLPLKRRRLQVHVGELTEDNFKRKVLEFQQVHLPSIIKDSALNRVSWHKNQGHEIWVVSASYDFLLSEWCKQMNIGLIVNLTFRNQHTCIFEGEDCNFKNKVYQIRKRVNLNDYTTVYAYGDSDGDKALLSLAHKSYFNYFK